MIDRGFLMRYGAAVGWTAVALLLTVALPDRLERHVSSLFIAAVMLSGWSGGLGPGLLATALSTLSMWNFLHPKVSSIPLTVDEAIRVTLFVAVAVFISYLNEARRHAEGRLFDLLVREKVARSKAEATEWRYAALIEAARILTSSYDPETTVTRLADLAVSRFADSCVVDLLRQDGSLRRIAEVWRDGARAESTADPRSAEAARLIGKVLQTGRPEVTPTSVIVPLVARGKTLGTISFRLTGSDRHYGSEDTAFAHGLSRYTALALDRGGNDL